MNSFSNINEAFTELLKGKKGATGSKGLKGHVGDVGLRGLDGKIGNKGITGLRGPQGKAGFIGDIGDQGNTGVSGARGNQGQRGIQGPRGEKGAIGPKGSRGDTGSSGINGERGNTGSKGQKGSSGSQYSNISIQLEDSCTLTTVVDDGHGFAFGSNSTYAGLTGREATFCPSRYAMNGLVTYGWKNQIKEYEQGRFKSPYYTFKWTTLKKRHGYQVGRNYQIYCCPALKSSNLTPIPDNLDEYNKYDSIRNYPFHAP